MSTIKLGYFGDGGWAQNALEKLIEDKSFEVMFIAPRASSPDQTLINIAANARIPVFFWPNVNDTKTVQRISSFQCDLLVSMSFDQIFKQELIQLPRLGLINCHAGRLPFYRGRNVLNWALINGEKEFGVTVHYVDACIDTGDIICQDIVSIHPDDDYGTVLSKAERQCAETLYGAICAIRQGQAKRTPQNQIHPVGFYCGQRRDGDEWIDWSWSSLRIANFVRGLARPGPGARTIKGNETWIVLKAEQIEEAPTYIGTTGEVVGRTDQGVLVKTGDSVIHIKSMTRLTPPAAAPGRAGATTRYRGFG
jgi:methionyl-tRNA formyltransferase